MHDQLLIQGLAVECRIGVSEEEQAKAQTMWIDLAMSIDAAKAARHDDVREAVDYAALVGAMTQCVQDKPYRLLETLAEDVAALILQQFGVPQVTVRVKKRAPLPGIDYAAVEITRGGT